MSFTVVIASDHGGFRLKQHVIEHLRSLGVVVQDLGPESSVRCDYPDYANLVCTAVQSAPECTLGVLVCGTGIGMSMTANKHAGIRAAVVSDAFSAKALGNTMTVMYCVLERGSLDLDWPVPLSKLG